MSRLTKEQAGHIVARVCGVTPTDSKVEAANKAIATMKAAGFPARAIRKAEAIRDQLIAQEAGR